MWCEVYEVCIKRPPLSTSLPARTKSSLVNLLASCRARLSISGELFGVVSCCILLIMAPLPRICFCFRFTCSVFSFGCVYLPSGRLRNNDPYKGPPPRKLLQCFLRRPRTFSAGSGKYNIPIYSVPLTPTKGLARKHIRLHRVTRL